MPEYFIEFKDADGSPRGGSYFSKPNDSEALGAGRGLLTSKRRADATVAVGVVWQRVIGVSDRANEIGTVKP